MVLDAEVGTVTLLLSPTTTVPELLYTLTKTWFGCSVPLERRTLGFDLTFTGKLAVEVFTRSDGVIFEND